MAARLTGAQILKRNLVQNLACAASQKHRFGIDLTLKSISSWTSTAENVEFCEFSKPEAITREFPFDDETRTVTLMPGDHMADFHESFCLPRGLTATIRPHPLLGDTGVSVCGGYGDAGSGGPLKALLNVSKPDGFVVHESSKLVRLVFHEGYKIFGDDRKRNL